MRRSITATFLIIALLFGLYVAAPWAWNTYITYRDNEERAASAAEERRNAAIVAKEEEQRNKARSAEWQVRMCTGLLALVDANLEGGASKTQSAADIFSATPTCAFSPNGTTTCKWSNLVHRFGRFSGTGVETSDPRGDLRLLGNILNKCLISQHAELIYERTMVTKRDLAGSNPFLKRVYKTIKNSKPVFIDTAAESSDTTVAFETIMELTTANHELNKDPILLPFIGESRLSAPPFHNQIEANNYIKKLMPPGLKCSDNTKQKRFMCYSNNARRNQFSIRSDFDPKNGAFGIRFGVTVVNDYGFRPDDYPESFVDTYVVPVLKSIGLKDEDVEACTKGLAKDIGTHLLLTDSDRNFLLFCGSKSIRWSGGALVYFMTERLSEADARDSVDPDMPPLAPRR